MSKTGFSFKKSLLTIFLKYCLPAFIFIPFLILLVCLFCASRGIWGPLPDFQELENPETNLATEILSSDNEILGKYFYENRTHVQYNELSPLLIQALIATEDERFFNHSGIDFIALARVLKGVLTGNSSLGGGSTITQQLAKMFFSKKPNSKIERVQQKFKEWIIAVRIERKYSKEEIITMYLNRFDFLNLAVGIKSASKIYFDTTPAELKLEEAATLVGMAKNPSQYNPLRRMEETTQRRNIVLNQMVKNNYLSQEKRDSLILLPIVLNYKKVDHNEGNATYFREHLRSFMTDWAEQRFKETGEKYNIYTDGLKIYTTIDSKMQKHAEYALKNHIENLQTKFYAHWDGFENAPYDTSWRVGQIDTLVLIPAIKRSERYRKLKNDNISEKKILEVFNTSVEMSVFSWKGRIDTLLSPIDSIKYYNYFLHSGLISIDPSNGNIKAWVGGLIISNLNMIMCMAGKGKLDLLLSPLFMQQLLISSTISPVLKFQMFR